MTSMSTASIPISRSTNASVGSMFGSWRESAAGLPESSTATVCG